MFAEHVATRSARQKLILTRRPLPKGSRGALKIGLSNDINVSGPAGASRTEELLASRNRGSLFHCLGLMEECSQDADHVAIVEDQAPPGLSSSQGESAQSWQTRGRGLRCCRGRPQASALPRLLRAHRSAIRGICRRRGRCI